MSDVARKDKICRNCTWWKHEQGKKICQRSAPRFSCKDWAHKEIPKACANCRFFNDFDECDSRAPDYLCMSWESIDNKAKEQQNSLPAVIDRNEVRQLLKNGESPLAISEKLGIELVSVNTPLHVDLNQISILKHHLNTVFTVLPAAELKARTEPGQGSIAALTTLIATSRDILDDINNRQDPGEQYAQFSNELLAPLTSSFLEVITRNFKDLQNKTRDLIPPENYGVFDQSMNLVLKSLASEMQGALEKHMQKLQEMLGVSNEQK